MEEYWTKAVLLHTVRYLMVDHGTLMIYIGIPPVEEFHRSVEVTQGTGCVSHCGPCLPSPLPAIWLHRVRLKHQPLVSENIDQLLIKRAKNHNLLGSGQLTFATNPLKLVQR